jgi:hypothetical protein
MSTPKQNQQWYEHRPEPKNLAACIEKIFELAAVPFGMMPLEESEEWSQWLAQVKEKFHGAIPPGTEKEKFRAATVALRKIARLTHDYRTTIGCSICGRQNHNKKTCPEKTDE